MRYQYLHEVVDVMISRKVNYIVDITWLCIFKFICKFLLYIFIDMNCYVDIEIRIYQLILLHMNKNTANSFI